MKSVHVLSAITSLFVLGAQAQQAGPGVNTNAGAGNLPPGLQNRQQLPPGLEKRDQLPPGLRNRQGTTPGQTGAQPQTGTNTDALQGQTGAGAQIGNTNQFGTGSVGGTTTNRYGSTTNQTGVTGTNHYSGTTSTNESELAPTSRDDSGSRIYSTNSINVTNRMTIQIQEDQAFTPADRQLLGTVRRTIHPMLSTVVNTTGTSDATVVTSTPTTTPNTTSTTVPGPWSPVHFIVRDQVVTLVGYVPSAELKQQVVTRVQRVPGVIRVVDRLEVRTESATEIGAGTTGQQGAVGGTTQHDTGTTTGGGSSATMTNETSVTAPGTTNQGSLSSGAGASAMTNRFGAGSTNQFGLDGTNRYGGATNLVPTSPRTNTNRVYPGSTNQTGTNNLPPTGRDSDRNYGTNENRRGLPPGLQKREQLPPGLEKREELPPGLDRRANGGGPKQGDVYNL